MTQNINIIKHLFASYNSFHKTSFYINHFSKISGNIKKLKEARLIFYTFY